LAAGKDTTLLELHDELRKEARKLYEDNLSPGERAADWREALWEARKLIIKALRASDCLRGVSAALQQSGCHMLVLRHLMAPPTSQDQFALICPIWSKSSENSGAPVIAHKADEIAERFAEWRSSRLTPWLKTQRPPSLREVSSLMTAVAPLIAEKRVATARRNRLARLQEDGLMERLLARGWKLLSSRTIDKQGAIEPGQFMHKARFASSKKGRAEVDVAIGLTDKLVLALECKVTNDETNSVKRINDVLKKAVAWREHWGSFIQPAALLQGVIKRADVERLLEADVEVFWSHRLDLFDEWLTDQTEA
jgi:hypothetical protein